ncbi:hypothetical protein ODJ79_06480 [Actinoplanes sp. KI2]|uniref:hypothetical protein n=1 Tax=Actinoplanes sp. KI2 TaxID=2983315 RepID=UPI0021D5D948|nr:hypothetical protein [Actinoplanes sp. KI2]MCU7723351.1 hypothetical protein [Actinoplanes sp. KI2]
MRALPWLPTILGVAALAVFTIVTIVRLTPDHAQTLPPPEPPFALPGTTSGPQAPVSLIPSTDPTMPATPTTDPTSPDPKPTSRAMPAVITPSRATTTEPARPILVSGHYHVLNSYADNFIGEVLLSNRTGAEQHWTVTLTYPGNLRTSWLESLPQPTLVQRGHTFTWTSSVPLAAGSSGRLRFQFDKVNGSETPGDCTVNWSACT